MVKFIFKQERSQPGEIDTEQRMGEVKFRNGKILLVDISLPLF